MSHSARLVNLVSARLSEFVEDRATILAEMSPDLAPFVEYSQRFLSGGKRFRALFAYWGFHAVAHADLAGSDPLDADLSIELPVVVSAAAALELFHAAALVHDDLIDNSETRRGGPAAHVLFRTLHESRGFSGQSFAFGRSAALLFGDLFLGWSDELLDEGLASLPNRAAARMARYQFNLMRTEVTAGQYLDLLEEMAWNTVDDVELRIRAERVALFKSAKYSVEAPLLIGAAIAGATAADRSVLSNFGRPLGMAFQLRDDLLGVYGDPATTGKPAGDDLIEGKRTVLIAMARERLAPGARHTLDELLGNPDLTELQVRMLQQTIVDCGAAQEVEQLIADYVAQAITALEAGQLSRAASAELKLLATSVAHREH